MQPPVYYFISNVNLYLPSFRGILLMAAHYPFIVKDYPSYNILNLEASLKLGALTNLNPDSSKILKV